MAETAEQEPTMEEILASIRRIISEDDEPAAEEPKAAEPAKPAPAPTPAPAPAPRPVLAEKPKPRPAPIPVPEPVEEEVLELTERVDHVEDDISFDEPAIARAVRDDDGYVSTPVADAAASAFGQLVGQMLVSSRGTEGKTLEDIVRELLKPMLRAWLDENLRHIVEARVAEEVERIAARSRR